MNKSIEKYINTEIQVLNRLDKKVIDEVIKILYEALEKERNIYVFGNGGSGSTASHLYNDFSKAIFERTEKTFKIHCLNDNIPYMLAISNDIGYDEVFSYQLRKCNLDSNSIIIAISGSGNSKNIVKAIKYAKSKKAIVIGLTGFDGGKLKQLADYSIDAMIDDMRITEDVHLMINHLIINTLYESLGIGEYIKDE